MDANLGEPWSKMDLDDLKASLAFGNRMAATASMLCTRHFERDPIPYALETDWPVGAGGFEPLHLRIGMHEDSPPGAAGFCQDSQPGGGTRTFASRIKGAPDRRLDPVDAG